MIVDTARSGKKTVFLHVMKTGGMTFRRILSGIYGDSFHVCDDPSIAAIQEALLKFDCLEFHIMPHNSDWIHLHAEVVQKQRWDLLEGRHIFTMIRRPVDQILSQYLFMQGLRTSLEPLMRASGVPFPETVDEFLDQPAYFNNQVAFLVGKSQRWGNYVDRDDLAQAKDMLLGLHVHVGLTEHFADSMNIFETVTGLKIPDQSIVNQNETKKLASRGAISDKVKQRIQEQSLLDLELYEFGRELFLEDLARCGSTPSYSFVSAVQSDQPLPRTEAPLAERETRATGSHSADIARDGFTSTMPNSPVSAGLWSYLRSKAAKVFHLDSRR